MKKLQITSIIVLVTSIIAMLLWQFLLPVSDWIIRITGIASLLSLFTMVFSSVRLRKANQHSES